MYKLFWIVCLGVLLNACSVYEDVEFKGITDFKLGKLQGRNVSFTFNALLYNPNGYALKVKPSDLDVFVEDDHYGVIHLDERVKFKRKSETLVEIPMTAQLTPGALFKLAALGGKEKVTVRLKGDVKGSVWCFSHKEKVDETREIATRDLLKGLKL